MKDEGQKSKVAGKEKVPNLFRIRDWILFIQSQAVAGSNNALVAAA